MADVTIYYEHPQWFVPLFKVLDRRGVSWSALPVQDHVLDPTVLDAPSPVIFNRMAMSSFVRQPEHALYHGLAALAHWELAGARVINGTAPLSIDLSKARQLSLFRAHGAAVPRTRVVHRREDVRAAARVIGFPLIIKPNVGGSGTGVTRYDGVDELDAALEAGTVPAGVDNVILIQEYVPAREGRVIRCETLQGKSLYSIALSGAGSTFDLCPADVCRIGDDKPAIFIESYRPPSDVVRAVESIARAACLDVGGIEYIVDERDGIAKFYDFNALSNFVAQPIAVLGWDPHEQLVDYLIEVIGARRAA